MPPSFLALAWDKYNHNHHDHHPMEDDDHDHKRIEQPPVIQDGTHDNINTNGRDSINHVENKQDHLDSIPEGRESPTVGLTCENLRDNHKTNNHDDEDNHKTVIHHSVPTTLSQAQASATAAAPPPQRTSARKDDPAGLAAQSCASTTVTATTTSTSTTTQTPLSMSSQSHPNDSTVLPLPSSSSLDSVPTPHNETCRRSSTTTHFPTDDPDEDVFFDALEFGDGLLRPAAVPALQPPSSHREPPFINPSTSPVTTTSTTTTTTSTTSTTTTSTSTTSTTTAQPPSDDLYVYGMDTCATPTRSSATARFWYLFHLWRRQTQRQKAWHELLKWQRHYLTKRRRRRPQLPGPSTKTTTTATRSTPRQQLVSCLKISTLQGSLEQSYYDNKEDRQPPTDKPAIPFHHNDNHHPSSTAPSSTFTATTTNNDGSSFAIQNPFDNPLLLQAQGLMPPPSATPSHPLSFVSSRKEDMDSAVPCRPPCILSWGTVTVYYHLMTLGDHPCVTSGVPVTLQWHNLDQDNHDDIVHDDNNNTKVNTEKSNTTDTKKETPQTTVVYQLGPVQDPDDDDDQREEFRSIWKMSDAHGTHENRSGLQLLLSEKLRHDLCLQALTAQRQADFQRKTTTSTSTTANRKSLAVSNSIATPSLLVFLASTRRQERDLQRAQRTVQRIQAQRQASAKEFFATLQQQQPSQTTSWSSNWFGFGSSLSSSSSFSSYWWSTQPRHPHAPMVPLDVNDSIEFGAHFAKLYHCHPQEALLL